MFCHSSPYLDGTDKLVVAPSLGQAAPHSALERFRAKHALGLDPGVESGSREENASKQESRASVPIQSERKRF